MVSVIPWIQKQTAGPNNQEPKKLITPTEEQKEIIRTDLAPGSALKVIAFAGTGKTTTLVEYAKARPHLRFLYVAFNKSVEVNASKQFPANVTCKTSHALAFPTHGAKYQNRLVTGLSAHTVMQALQLHEYEEAKYVIETLMNYLVSADPDIFERHVPPIALKKYRKGKFVYLANRLQILMYSGKNPTIGMLHDGYLKEYQLSRPKLNYDILLLDEAQDLNPVTANIFLQQASPKLLVGDPHQQIYSFRGASNLIKKSLRTKLTI